MKLSIGAVIRDRRRAMDLTQEQLAETLGVTCQSVSRWENGLTYPDIEMLPLLADTFGISLDELMGHTRSAREKRLSDLWDEGEAITDPEARFDHLARMKEEFPEQWSIAHAMLNLISTHGIRREELSPLAMEVLENCPNETIRWDVTKIFLHNAEEEDVTSEFLVRFTQRFDRNTLLETRYMKREDWPRYQELRRRNLIHQLFKIMDEQLCGYAPASADHIVWAQKTAMEIIHLLTGYRAEPSAGLSGLVDTRPDLWFAIKYWIGLRLSCGLAALGQAEEALAVLEHTVTAIETVLRLPEETVLSYRTRALDRTDAEIVSRYMKGPWCCVELQPVDGDLTLTAAELAHLHQTAEGFLWYCPSEKNKRNRIWYVDLYLLDADKGWEGFDPIRQHPRYLACAERMRALRESVTS